MSGVIDIRGIPKAELLCALVNGTRPLGMGVLQARGPMTVERAQEWIDACRSHDVEKVLTTVRMHSALYFDYVEGRPVKCDIGGDFMHFATYDRDAGRGAAAFVIAKLRERFPAPDGSTP